MQTIKISGVTVKVYRVKRATTESYLLAYYLNGRRQRQTFKGDLNAAREKAAEIAKRISSQTAGNCILAPSEAEGYWTAMRTLKPVGVPLVAAVQEYVAARQRIGGRSLLDAADFYAKTASLDLPKKPLVDVAQELVDAKKADGVSKEYRQMLAYNLGAACKVLTKPIPEITPAEIDDYLRSLKVSTCTRHNARAALVTAFAFARGRGYLSRDRQTAADLSTRIKVKTGEVEIFTPREMAALLAAASEISLPLIALGGFAGLRTAEISRLEWKDINFAEGLITVSAAKSKTASRRIVPIQPNLAQWLAPWANASGLVLLHADTTRMEKRAATAAGISWKHNALRHSFGSYRLAHIKNAAEVSLEMGNSPAMIFRHYRELVTPQEAALWWNISPKQAENVVQMSKHKASV